ncbi:2-oxoisovalerate dehydrogenase subunit alpha 1-mitochondrial [Striga hermonthica]|uniref:2-oxoisovalerate dehydrogenase subunit alpha 1-mitochondrial n=1 Tax=Striga hermonthica TaxID=68872 RepID=A0A9N7NM99_STRHE|nr:2-oxoisovalerate dehydrogenase subunit alpha 1-mitochondrial [Striga hermonthica]
MGSKAGFRVPQPPPPPPPAASPRVTHHHYPQPQTSFPGPVFSEEWARPNEDSYFRGNYFWFHAYSASYKTLAGGFSRNPRGSWVGSSAFRVFRRPESARAGEQVEAVAYTDYGDGDDDEDDENQGLDFPGGKVAFTPQMKFISESLEKKVPCYRVLDDDGYIIPGSTFERVDKSTAVRMYRSMVTLQIMDSFFYEAQRQGRLSFYMTSTGEEAVNIATAAALSSDDVVLPQYREPGILLWRGFTLEQFTNQLFGTKYGSDKGRQMPVHYGSKQHNYLTVSSPIATQLPQAAGVAYSLKMDNKEACVVAFMGDGCTSEGDFHAGLNFAAVMEAPVIFVCRNNGYAISTPTSEQFRSIVSTPTSEQFRSDGVVVKGQAYGIRSIRVDGNDTLAVYSAIRVAREMTIREHKPVLVEALTYRVGHHSTSDDSTKYRPSNEIDHWKTARNPTNRFRKWVQRNGWWTDEDENELRSSTRKQVLSAIHEAGKIEKPSLEELFTDVYDRVPSNLHEQEKSLREFVVKNKQDYPVDVPL